MPAASRRVRARWGVCDDLSRTVIEEVALGVDVGELRRKGFDLVALDRARRIVFRATRVGLEDARRIICDEIKPQVVCIDAPTVWAVGPGQRRAAEQALGRLGIRLFATPCEARAVGFHQWMRDGLALYDALSGSYRRYDGGAVNGAMAEVFPHACAVALLGFIPPLREKRSIRRNLLERHGVDVSLLSSQDQVDAALAALAGVIALEDGHSAAGEGIDTMLLPARPLPARFEARP
ncbi:MAG: DUF429 domain-containing protein [Proteobacteria bacterium]|nr:DUF429 domain-containing protein [Pseudomonadota bacterium]